MDLAFDRVTFELTGRTSVSTDTVRVFVRATVAGIEFPKGAGSRFGPS